MNPQVPSTLEHGTPLVSVVVPCFGEGRFLDDCLWSLRRQHHRQLEIVVIDDAGHDDSMAVALDHAAHDDRIVVMRTRANVGLGAVRNIALDVVRGELVTFVDGDDLLPPRSISARVEALAAALRGSDPGYRQRIVGVFGDWRYATAAIDRAPAAERSRALVAVELAASGGGNVFIVSAPLVRTDELRHAGGFATGVTGGEDYIAWMRLLARGGVIVPCQEVVAVYRQKAASMVRSSAGEYAALAAAGRTWVDEAATAVGSTPGAWPVLVDLAAGEHTIEFGTVVDRAPMVSASPVAPPSPATWSVRAPAGPRPPSAVAARMAVGAVLLRDAGARDHPGPGLDIVRRPSAGAGSDRLVLTGAPAPTGAQRSRSASGASITVRADTFVGGMVAAAIAVLLQDRMCASLALSPTARNGALRLLVRTGFPDGLELTSPGHVAPPESGDIARAEIVAGPTPTVVDRTTTPDALALVAAALRISATDGPVTAQPEGRPLLVMGPGSTDPVAWFDRAGDRVAGGLPHDVSCASTDSRTARRCADAGVATSVVTLEMMIAASSVVSDDADIVLLAHALRRPTLDLRSPVGTPSTPLPAVGPERDDLVAALVALLGADEHTTGPRHGGADTTR